MGTKLSSDSQDWVHLVCTNVRSVKWSVGLDTNLLLFFEFIDQTKKVGYEP